MEKFHQEPNIYVGEVNIKVEELDRAVTFYENIMGLGVLERTVDRVVLTANGTTALVTLEQPADVIPLTGRHSGLFHFALLVPTRGELAVFLRHLIQTNYPFGAGDHNVSEALYITDPDGNGIEVYWDRPSSEWKWDNGLVEMATLQIDAKGILAESDAPWNGLPTSTIMGHIHLHVGDLKKAEQFYNDVLGFKTVSYYPQAAFMSTGEYHHHIAINTWQGVGAPTPPKNRVGLNNYTLVYPNEALRQSAITQLEQSGVPLIQELNGYLTSDPAGNRIRLVV
ncbi:catechol 2,3-dioxygenase [Paenibacillus sp. DS2015]|uniref:VOC family protein n=1 Tax=Paenibacillus sp. DS2015 TaxID=3373917 RepID=UPI003D22132D